MAHNANPDIEHAGRQRITIYSLMAFTMLTAICLSGVFWNAFSLALLVCGAILITGTRRAAPRYQTMGALVGIGYILIAAGLGVLLKITSRV